MRNNVWVQNGGFATASGSVFYIGNTEDNRVASIVGGFDDDTGAGTNGLVTESCMHALDIKSGRWVRVRASAVTSGGGYLIHALVSGQPMALINDGIRNVVVISGQTVHDNASSLVTAPMVACIGTSGGTQMPNQPCVRARIRSVSGNDVMFVGGIGAHAPFSGKGQQLYGGEAMDYDVTNFNAISVFAVTAGQLVSVDGVN